MTPWTLEMEMDLLRLWNDGKSFSRMVVFINKKYGQNFSRSAIAGKSWRMRGKK